MANNNVNLNELDYVLVKRNSVQKVFQIGVTSRTVLNSFGVVRGVIIDKNNVIHGYHLVDPFYSSFTDRIISFADINSVIWIIILILNICGIILQIAILKRNSSKSE